MGLFRKKKTEGLIKYYDLIDWWETSFSEEQKKYIISKYIPMGMIESNLVKGKITSQNVNASYFLSNLSAWFNTKKDREIALAMVQKSEELFDEKIAISDLHFHFLHMIKFFYKDREHSKSYEKSKLYCRRQIEISEKAKKDFLNEFDSNLPSHTGYKQLAIILEKEGKISKAIDLSKKAKNEGWTDDWDKRIEKLEKKLK